MRLVDAVGRLLQREGFSSLGVNSVAREARVDKVLIYRYFGGLDGLLRAFAESGTFWPTITEIVGEGADDLRLLPPEDRWATGLVRYARALRRRPIIRDVLTWEQVEKTELTEILRIRRETWFAELLRVLPDDTSAVEIDPIETVLLMATSIHYLVARSKLHGDFNGLPIEGDAAWAHIENLIHTIARRSLTMSAQPG